MTIDERIERLTERHEALAQSVEILRGTVHETSDAVRHLAERTEENSATLSRLMEILQQTLGAVGTLASAANDHERRI